VVNEDNQTNDHPHPYHHKAGQVYEYDIDVCVHYITKEARNQYL